MIPTQQVQEYGPGALRSKDALAPVLRELEELNRVRIVPDHRHKVIVVNPALLIEEGAR